MSGEVDDAEAPARRVTHVEHDVVYASVGASAASDLVRFPPQGSSPFEHLLQLGSGAERFTTASSTLMTWGAQRAVGIEVGDVEHPDEDHYAGIVFDQDGVPSAAPDAEVSYGPDGEEFLTAGTVATMRWPKDRAVRRVRVVYVVDEARRSGFALGTSDAAGVIGEISFCVEHRADDTVWGVTRGFFWAPETGFFGLRARAAVRLAQRDAMQQLATLAPGAAAKGGATSRLGSDGEQADKSAAKTQKTAAKSQKSAAKPEKSRKPEKPKKPQQETPEKVSQLAASLSSRRDAKSAAPGSAARGE